jgi:hypothetical protein
MSKDKCNAPLPATLQLLRQRFDVGSNVYRARSYAAARRLTVNGRR